MLPSNVTLDNQLAALSLSPARPIQNTQWAGLLMGRTAVLVASSETQEFIYNPQKLLDYELVVLKGIATRLNVIAQNVYQQMASSNAVRSSLKLWQKNVGELDEEVAKCITRATKNCTYILATGAYRELTCALSTMLALETVASKVRQKSARLAPVLESQPYASTLEYLKTKITQFSGIISVKEDKREKEILALSTAVLNDPEMARNSEDESVLHIQSDVRRFCLYATKFFASKVAQVELLQDQQEVLVADAVVTNEDATNKDATSKVLEEQPISSKDSLPAENYFQVGRWFTTWSYIGYSQIAKQIGHMQKIAEKIWVHETVVLDRIQKASLDKSYLEQINEDLMSDTFVCQDLKKRTCEQILSLQVMIPSATIYAGLSYASGLLVQIKEIRAIIKAFQDTKPSVFGLHVNALYHVLVYLRQKDAFQNQDGRLHVLKLFYQAVKAVCAIKAVEYQKLYTVLNGLLATQAQETLKYSATESVYASQLNREEASWGYAPEIFESYLMAGLMRHLYLGKDEIEFKTALLKLREDPSNSSGFQRVLEESKEFNELYQALLNI